MWIRQKTDAASPSRHHGPDEHRLRAWVDALARPRHFWAEARENRRVGERVAGELARLGLDVTFQGPYRNVVALPPRRAQAPLVMIAAHYDSVPGCPGADDNASGLAVMLECARALAGARAGGVAPECWLGGTTRRLSDLRPDRSRDASRSVGFVAFNAEEDGMLGSRDFVATGLRQLRLSVAAVHVLDMCGFRASGPGTQRSPLPFPVPGLSRGTFIAVLGQGASNTLADAAASAPLASPHRVALKTFRGAHGVVPDLARSDHAPFWNAELPALLWTDTGNFRNPHYHRASDTPETLDYVFMNAVRNLVCHVVMNGGSR